MLEPLQAVKLGLKDHSWNEYWHSVSAPHERNALRRVCGIQCDRPNGAPLHTQLQSHPTCTYTYTYTHVVTHELNGQCEGMWAYVEVPRPTSSQMTRDCEVALFIINAASEASTANVLRPSNMLSLAPTRVKMASITDREKAEAHT